MNNEVDKADDIKTEKDVIYKGKTMSNTKEQM